MVEKTLVHYDYVAFQVFWSGTKNINKKSVAEQTFLRSFFSKYQLLVITEDGYRRNDKVSRIKHIVKNTPGLANDLGHVDTITDIRNKIMTLFNNDLRKLTGLSDFPSEAQPIQLAEQGVFAMKRRELPTDMRRRVDTAVQQEFRNNSSSERQQLLQTESRRQGVDHMSAEQYQRLQADRAFALIQTYTQDAGMALSLQIEALEERVKVQDTQTQIDNESIVQQVEATKSVQQDLKRLINQTQMGQSWDNIPLKDLPKWLKSKCVAGLKRLAITSVMLPIYYGPKAIINNLIIQPLATVIEDVMFLKKWLQRILGWTIVVFIIAGTVVIINHPDYEDERRFWKEQYNIAVDYIPIKFISDPTRQTFNVIWSKVPGQKFLFDITDVVKGWAFAVPGLLLTWFSQLITTLTSFMKEVIINSVKDWWSGK